ncbi:MAG: hypothetical protein ABIO92_06855, partial [Chloroflexia bacterium]
MTGRLGRAQVHLIFVQMKNRIRLNRILALAALLLAAIGTYSLPSSYAQTAGRFYPETSKTLAPEFVAYYDAKGGLPIFGYPLTDAEIEGG